MHNCTLKFKSSSSKRDFAFRFLQLFYSLCLFVMDLQRERRFEKKMRKIGFIIKKMGEDGACLFRAVADQVYGDQEMHSMIRDHCMDYVVSQLNSKPP